MPTGYTACIERDEPVTFEEFLMGCARGMSACVSMREMPHDAPIPAKFEPSDYHTKEHQRLTKEYDEICNLSIPDICRAMIVERSKEKKRLKDALEKAKMIAVRYDDMLSKAKAWHPPSNDHNGLKDFMIQQLELCMRSGSMEDYYKDELEKLEHALRDDDYEKWLNDKKDKLLKDIEYHTKEQAVEVERCAQRTKWVNILRESL